MIDMNKVWQQENPGARPWTKWGEKAAPNVGEDQWSRSPAWGAHVIHSDKYGWQDKPTVNQLYAGGGDLSSLTPQIGNQWREFYGDRRDYNERVANRAAKAQQQQQPAADYSQYFNQGQQQQPTRSEGRPIGDPNQQQVGQFQYPWQMDVASNVMSNFAQGAPTQLPWQWGQGSDVASQMAQTGMPTSYAPAYQASKGVVERDIVSAIKQAGEEAGVEGLRYSTPMDAMSKRIAAEKMGQLGAQWTGQELGAQEAARGRQLQALPQMYQFGAGGAGLAESAKDRGLSAAGGLAGLGQQYANLPMDWSQRMMGMGSQMYGQDQGALDRQYQDYMRMAPESNPYMNYGMQFMGQPSQMGYQQYQPSFFSSLLGMLPGLALGAGPMGAGLIGG